MTREDCPACRGRVRLTSGEEVTCPTCHDVGAPPPAETQEALAMLRDACRAGDVNNIVELMQLFPDPQSTIPT